MKRVGSRFFRFAVFCVSVLSSLQLMAAPPTFSIAFSPTTIGPGSTATLVYTIDNSAESTAVSALSFNNTLPSGISIANPASDITTCKEGSYSALAGGTNVAFNDYRLGKGESCTLSLDVTIATTGTHTNTTSTLSSSAGSAASATASLTVDASRPGFSMAFSPSSITPGAVSTLTYTIDNSANAGAIDSTLIFSHTLPSNVTVSSAPNASTTCTAGTFTPVVTADSGSSGVNLSSGSVTGNSTCTVSLDVTASTAGIYTTTTNDLSQNGSNPSGKASSLLTVSKPFLYASFPASSIPGTTVDLSFTMSNLDRNNAATGITFTNDLNATLSGLAATALPANGFCGTGSTITGSSTITISGASLAAEESCTFKVSVLVPANSAAGNYTNTTSTINLTLGSATTKAAVSNVLTVVSAPIVSSTFIDDPVSAGADVTLRYVINNSDPTNSATNIAFTEDVNTALSGVVVKTLPAANACGSGSTFTSQTLNDVVSIVVSGANLTGGASCTFDVILTIPFGASPGTYAYLSSAISATVLGKTVYAAPVTDNLVVLAAPSLSLAIVEDVVSPGGTVIAQFTLEYSGNASAEATGIGFTVDLDAALSGLVSSSASQSNVCGSGSSLSGTSTLVLSGATLAVGDTCTFSVILQVPSASAPGQLTITSSSISGTTSSTSVQSGAGSDTLLISGLTFSKSFVDDPALPGATAILRYTISNSASALAASSIGFSDDLNKVISGLAATSLPSTPCGAGSSITGTTSLSFSGGLLSPGASCTFDVSVLVPAGASEGTYNSVTSNTSAVVNSISTTYPDARDTLAIETLSILLSTTATEPTETSPIPIKIHFSRPVTNFVVGDLTVGNGTASNFSGSGDTYTADITPTTDGIVTVDVAANVADDAVTSSVKNPAATQLSMTYTSVPVFPTPSLSISSPSATQTSSSNVSFTVSYSDVEHVNLTTSAISLNKTGTATASTVSVTNGKTDTATVVLSGISGDGSIGISIAKDSAQNGNNFAPSAGPSTTFLVDNTQPTLVISGPASAVDGAFNATFTFSEDVTGFALADITAVNATLSSFTASSATVYSATVTPDGVGSVSLDVASGVAVDGANNGNITASQYTVDLVTVNPTLVITTPSAIVNTAFTVTFTFSTGVVNFVVSDITLVNGTLSAFTAVSTSVYTATVTPSAQGAVTVDVAASVATDFVGNANNAGNQLSVVFDSIIVDPYTTSSATQGTVTPGIEGTAEPASTVTVSFTDDNGANIVYTIVIDSSGNWKVDTTAADDNGVVPLLSDGSSYSLSLTSADAAGNTSSITRSLNVDLTVPAEPCQ